LDESVWFRLTTDDSRTCGIGEPSTRLTAASKTKIVVRQQQSERNAEQSPNHWIRNGCDTDSRQEKNHRRDYVKNHSHSHLNAPLQEVTTFLLELNRFASVLFPAAGGGTLLDLFPYFPTINRHFNRDLETQSHPPRQRLPPSARPNANKKADVTDHPKVINHVGLLFNEPLGTAGLLFI
jgi:hypothetical protein